MEFQAVPTSSEPRQEPASAPIQAPRGVSPKILLEQVRNTVPFFLDDDSARAPYLDRLRSVARDLAAGAEPELSHAEYYALCLSAHHATVGSFVPTDVDNQIRFKLWHPTLPLDTIAEMADVTLESLEWDCRAASARWVRSPSSGKLLSGHCGEWFSTAAGAYGALRKRSPDRAAGVAGAILAELQREAEIYADLRKARDGLGLLRAATLIAHNLGDLDRVMDAWSLPADDPLRAAAYKAGHAPDAKSAWRMALYEAGCLNKAYMAEENHRHFALRKPKCLRRSADLLLPTGPFFDEWGSRVARHPTLSPEDVGEIVEALVDGWDWLRDAAEKAAAKANGGKAPATAARGPVGYARALAGIEESFPGGAHKLSLHVPARIARTLKSGPLRALVSVPRRRFEEHHAQTALKFRAPS